jgi:hypothetical protein
MINIEAIIWYLFLLDSVGANIMAWLFPKWAKKNLKKFWKHIPVTKAWAALYLALVLWVGYTLYRLGILPL